MLVNKFSRDSNHTRIPICLSPTSRSKSPVSRVFAMPASPKEIVADIGQRLGSQARPSKDFLVKSLRQAASALSDLEQLSSLKPYVSPLSKSLEKHGLVRHKDKDIRLLVAICFCEIMRVLAPEPSFGDKTLSDVFELFISMFAELGDTASPYFSRRVKILETLDALDCCLQLLDLGRNDLILKMFRTFFSVVREEHPQSLVNGMVSIMSLMFKYEVPQPLLDVVLHNLRNKGERLQPASYQLAARLIQERPEVMKPAVCLFLTSCMLDRDGVHNELRGSYHDTIYEIFLCAPDVVVAIIPNIIQELLTDQVDVRIKSINLIGKLLTVPKDQCGQENHHLFVALLKRFSDKVAEVRLSALRCAKACYMANPLGVESQEIISSVEGRLLDFDSSVRAEAVTVICDIAKFNLKSFPPELILRAMERLRDKMSSVRKEALKRLLEVYRHYCTKCSEGQMELSDSFEQIPCNILMLSYDKSSKDFRPQTLELVFVEDLFPASLSIAERTKHWIFLYSLFTPAHLKALDFLLSLKRRLRTEMHVYLSLRKKEKENVSEEVTRRMRTAVTRMSTVFLDPIKAEEGFSSLNQIKDDGVIDCLMQLLDEVEYETAKAIKVELLRKIGGKYPCAEFLKSLASKCFNNIFHSEHVRCILQHILSYRARHNSHEGSSVNLLTVIVSNFSLLLRGSEDQFKLLLLEDDSPFSEKLFQIMAKAAPLVSIRLSDVYPSLERLCLEGTHGQVKVAISAAIAMAGASEQLILENLCQKLLKSLCSGQSILNVLQALGYMAEHIGPIFQKQERQISSYIQDKIFRGKFSKDPVLLHEKSGGHISFDCRIKIYGLKVLVKSFLSKKGADMRRQLACFMDTLSILLKKGDFTDGTLMCDIDMAHLRLAAAKSVLQLSRRFDLHISPQIFQATILIAKDDSSFVRRLFLEKAHRLLKEHAIPSKYACAFAVATSVCEKMLQDAPFSYLAEFVSEYGRKALTGQSSATEKGSMTEYPAYVVVYLIHVLAHDETFPPKDCQDEEIYSQFCIPLYSFLHSLSNAQSDGDMDIVKSTFSCLSSIFRAIKKADDAVDHQKTLKLHKLAEIGSFFFKTMQHKGDSFPVPTRVLLPLSLYVSGQTKTMETDCSSGPVFDDFFLNMVADSIRLKFNQPTTTIKRGQKSHKDRLLANVKDHDSAILGNCQQISSSTASKGVERNNLVEEMNEDLVEAVLPHARNKGRGKDCPVPAATNDPPLGKCSLNSAISEAGASISNQEVDACIASLEDGQERNISDLKGSAVPLSQRDSSDHSSLDCITETDFACRDSAAVGRRRLRSDGKALSDRTNSLSTDSSKEQQKKRKGLVTEHPSSGDVMAPRNSMGPRTRRRRA